MRTNLDMTVSRLLAAALEAAGPGFDWGLCLGGGDSLAANRVSCAVAMARILLGADARHLPDKLRTHEPPRWLRAEVLRQWGALCTGNHLPPEPMAVSLRHPARVLPAVLARWPDPIRAAARVGAPFKDRRGVATQLIFFCRTAARFLRRCAARRRGKFRRPDAYSRTGSLQRN